MTITPHINGETKGDVSKMRGGIVYPDRPMQCHVHSGWHLTVIITGRGVLRSKSMTFAVSKGTAPMPALGTVGQGGTVPLDGKQTPPSGRTGTYVAHVPVKDAAVIDGTTIDGLPAAPPNT